MLKAQLSAMSCLSTNVSLSPYGANKPFTKLTDMLNTITNHTINYATYSATDATPKASPVLQKANNLDVYQRSDGTEATRFDMPAEKLPENENEALFRDLLHQFVGQTLIGQMLKSMRATQEKNPYFHGGQAEEIYQSMLDMELTDQLTQATSRTLSEPMYKLMRAPRAS